MPKKELPKPDVVSWPTWKVLPITLAISGIITAISWFSKEPGRYVGFNSIPPSFPPLTIGDILLGSGFLLIPFWNRWAWRSRRKYARWHRWLAGLLGAVYLCALALLWGIASWNALLNRPWNWAVNGVLVALFIMAWILPALSSGWSKKIARVQDALSLRMLAYGGPAGLMIAAGILGANYGMSASRHGEMSTALLVLAFGFPLVAIFVAQYNAEYLWPYRPWAKEEE